MLSMPSSAEDIAIHKLINFCPGNVARKLATSNGQVIACDPVTGETLFILDATAVTRRRTAAVSALGVITLLGRAPREILVIGTGKQASAHIEAFSTLFPGARLYVHGRCAESTSRFVRSLRGVTSNLEALAGTTPHSVDVVVAVTSSKRPVYEEPARSGRLIIGVGALTSDVAEFGDKTVNDSIVVVDDVVGANRDAGV
jgi:1-piperideine-2-carboxylate/1-pyrroline-2-carboxylate reductase [NAD(P)H]